jgi:anti-sigma-K factor RskA
LLVRLDILTVEDLSAYVDGELDEETAASVEAALRSDDRVAAFIEAFRRQIADLHRLHGGDMPQGGAGIDKIPPRLAHLINRHRHRVANDPFDVDP